MGSKVTGRLTTIAIVMALALWALLANWPLNLGLDLRGGTSLRYRLQLEDEDDAAAIQQQTVDVVRTRLNSLGLREIPVYAVGDDGIVVDLPGVGPEESRNIQRTIVSLGRLEFYMVADQEDGIDVEAEREKLRTFLAANEAKAKETWTRVRSTYQKGFRNEKGEPLPIPADWEILERSDLAVPELMTTEMKPDGRQLDFFWVPDIQGSSRPEPAQRYSLLVKETFPSAPTAEERNRFVFTGKNLSSAGYGSDPARGKVVSFELETLRKSDFGDYTGKYAGRLMAIVLDDQVHSAPRLEGSLPGSGQISGPQPVGFTEKEQRALVTVLQSGSLEVEMELESDSSVGPSLGEDSIDSGVTAIIIGLVLVFAFMLVYYRGAGVISSIALAINLLLLMSVLALMQATLTLPGLAGIVLTVGMAVDANILIFERVREEREKGKTLNQAFKNGFERALVTILDANITTLITALVLQQLGTGPVKGFAITLSIGILTSMFAALYVTRALFELFAQKGLLKDLKSMHFLSNPSFEFMGNARKAMTVTLSLIVVGVVLTVMRGNDSLGLDFVGGYELKLQFAESQNIDEVREVIGREYQNPQVVSVGDEDKIFAIKLRTEEDVDPDRFIRNVSDHVHEDFKGKLAPELVDDLSIDESVLTSQSVSFRLNFMPAEQQNEGQAALDKERVESLMLSALTTVESVEPVADTGYQTFQVQGKTRSLEVSESNPRDDLLSRIGAATRDYKGSSAIPESSYIGPMAAKELEEKAIFAILISLILIVLYIRLRFHEFKYGLAAVAALVHDVLFSLGAVVACSWSGFINVEIDLPMIAAFLTIIGYSLNDTIVVFDRVRENLPKYPKASLPEVINTSINQTLSRTILTSVTTFVVVAILFVMNKGKKNVLEGFSFAMVIGVVIGTYSSIFIASPVVVMIHKYNERKQAKEQGAGKSNKVAAVSGS
ncbi:MAG: protein translocase subunit SecD [Planctomycetota bacterium]